MAGVKRMSSPWDGLTGSLILIVAPQRMPSAELQGATGDVRFSNQRQLSSMGRRFASRIASAFNWEMRYIASFQASQFARLVVHHAWANADIHDQPLCSFRTSAADGPTRWKAGAQFESGPTCGLLIYRAMSEFECAEKARCSRSLRFGLTRSGTTSTQSSAQH
jgi:hypothetical protein